MKIEKTYDLLNSEGALIKIEKIGGFWHYKFDKSKTHTITTAKEILNSILNGKGIVNKNEGKIYFLEDYPLSMKGDTSEYYERIVRVLVQEEMDKCTKDTTYFKENYLSKCK
jgi:hypothetical protein